MIFEYTDRIVFAGDSVTDMDRARPAGEGLFEGAGKSYVKILENMLSVWYPERRLRITSMGVSDNTSRDLLARWEQDVTALKPQWVSICIGVNDVWRQFDSPAMPEQAVSPEEYRQNVKTMLLKAEQGTKGVFLMTPYYMEPNREDPMRRRMDEYGAICRDLAQKHGARFIDLQAMFDRYFAHHHSSFIAWDRVHPNQVGATLIAREFLKHCDFDYQHEPESERSAK